MLSDKVVSAVQSALVDAGFLAAESFVAGAWDRNTASAYDYFIYNKLPPVPVELRGFAPLSPTGLHESVVELLGGWDVVLAIDEEDSEDAEASDYDNDGDVGEDNDDEEVVTDPSEHSVEELGITDEDATVTDGEQASEEAPAAAEETVEDTSDAEEAPAAEEAAGDEETKEESDANTEVSDAPADEVKEDDAPAVEETPVKKSSKKNKK